MCCDHALIANRVLCLAHYSLVQYRHSVSVPGSLKLLRSSIVILYYRTHEHGEQKSTHSADTCQVPFKLFCLHAKTPLAQLLCCDLSCIILLSRLACSCIHHVKCGTWSAVTLKRGDQECHDGLQAAKIIGWQIQSKVTTAELIKSSHQHTKVLTKCVSLRFPLRDICLQCLRTSGQWSSHHIVHA